MSVRGSGVATINRGVARLLRARDFAVGFRAAVAEKLPGGAHLIDLFEVEFGDDKLVLVAGGLRNDFAARVAEVALAVEFPDFPGNFKTDAGDGRTEIAVGDGVGGLLELPKIFGEPGNGGGGIEDNFGAVEGENARAFGELAIVTDVHGDAAEARLEDGIAGVARCEIELFPEARMDVRDVVLAVFAEVAAVGV